MISGIKSCRIRTDCTGEKLRYFFSLVDFCLILTSKTAKTIRLPKRSNFFRVHFVRFPQDFFPETIIPACIQVALKFARGCDTLSGTRRCFLVPESSGLPLLSLFNPRNEGELPRLIHGIQHRTAVMALQRRRHLQMTGDAPLYTAHGNIRQSGCVSPSARYRT